MGIYPKLKVTVWLEQNVEGVLDDNVKKLKSSKLVDEYPRGSIVFTESIQKAEGSKSCKSLASYISGITNDQEYDQNMHKFKRVNEVVKKIISQRREDVEKFNQKERKADSEKSARICWQRLIIERIPTCQVEYNVGKGKSLWLVVYGKDL